MMLEEVERRLSERMRTRFNDVYAYATQNLLTMRQAAMAMAVNRVVDAIQARGFLP